MTLAIYTFPIETAVVDSDNLFSVTFDGRIGGSIDRKLYVRNDNSERWYSSITITSVDTGMPIASGGIEGWGWRLLEKDVAPTTEEWLVEDPGNTVSLTSNIGSATEGDTRTYLPFWVRITVPPRIQVQTLTDVVLRISATEGLVT